jgi:hypothetical protein
MSFFENSKNMMKVLIAFFSIFVCIACGQVISKVESNESSQATKEDSIVWKENKENNECVTFKFHYLETENVLYTPVVRHIEIFLDEKAFSEENLKTLFAYISKKNPEPQHLTVIVHTNWAQLNFPSDCPGTGTSNMPARPDEYDYLQAIYYRRAKVEYFRYSPAIKVDSSKFKQVVLRNETGKSQ